MTTIFVTHDQEEAFSDLDRIAVLNKVVIEQIGTPVEICRRPASPFVAGFIGRTNRLRGAFDHAARSITVGGNRIAVEAGGMNRDLVEATLFLRPEDLRLETAATQANALPARVISATYGGATIDYLVETPVGELAVKRLAGDAALNVGDSAVVSWSGANGVVLDTTGA